MRRLVGWVGVDWVSSWSRGADGTLGGGGGAGGSRLRLGLDWVSGWGGGWSLGGRAGGSWVGWVATSWAGDTGWLGGLNWLDWVAAGGDGGAGWDAGAVAGGEDGRALLLGLGGHGGVTVWGTSGLCYELVYISQIKDFVME